MARSFKEQHQKEITKILQENKQEALKHGMNLMKKEGLQRNLLRKLVYCVLRDSFLKSIVGNS